MLDCLRRILENRLHKSPFSLKVFGDIVVGRRQDLFDCDVDPKVGPCRYCEQGINECISLES